MSLLSAATKIPFIPVNIDQQEFIDNAYEHYAWMHQNGGIYQTKFMGMIKPILVSSYADCMTLLKHPDIVRNRSTAVGHKFPLPLPKSITILTQSMVNSDDPDHARLRALVQQAFTPRRVRQMQPEIQQVVDGLLNTLEEKKGQEIDLIKDFSLAIPVTIIQRMLGVEPEDMEYFMNGMKILSKGVSFITVLETFLLDFPRLVKLTRRIIERKRKKPGDDIISDLISAEEQGQKLSTDEIVSMAFILVVAGYETTVHLISNTILALIDHPDQLALLKANPDLISSTIDEAMRFRGPVHSSETSYAAKDIEIAGHIIPKGRMVFPVFGAANHDPLVFENPGKFDIQRQGPKHLGFGHGAHFCLGAMLAQMEAKIAVQSLFNRFPELHLAVPRKNLELQKMPMWHRYKKIPLNLK